MAAPRPDARARARALAIVHGDLDPTGFLGVVGDVISRRADLDVRYIGDPLPDPADLDVVISFGSRMSAYDDSVPWLATELAYLREASAQTAVLGICFGAQAVARALGGDVRPAARSEIGWTTVETDDPDLIEPGPWFELHGDTFTLPPGALELARSEVGPQAFRIGRTLAVQFHPEITPEVFAVWEGTRPPGGMVAELAAKGVDRDELVASLEAGSAANRIRATRLVERFWDELVEGPAVDEQAATA